MGLERNRTYHFPAASQPADKATRHQSFRARHKRSILAKSPKYKEPTETPNNNADALVILLRIAHLGW